MTISSPYRDHWREYRTVWAGTIPLPWRRKDPPPPGVTGERGEPATDSTMLRWERSYVSDGRTWQTGNIGIHLPDGVIGVDLDVYKAPNVRALLEEHTGPLPLTICSTARVDGSGIRLYSCPTLAKGQRFKSAPFPGCEIIQKRHRYVVAWPSIHPDLDQPYLWIDERTGELPQRPPLLSEFAPLPAQAFGWLVETLPEYDARDAVEFDLTDGTPHDLVVAALEEALEAVTGEPGGRHDAMTKACVELARLAERGFSGVTAAVGVLRRTFIDTVGGQDRDAAKEFDSAMNSAKEIVKVTSPTMPTYSELEELRATLEIIEPDAVQMAEPSQATSHVPIEDILAKRDAERIASWTPLDLTPVMADDYEHLRPEWLTRPDGRALFYPQRVNMLMGESGGGKSWVALVAVAEAVNAGRYAVYVDLEDHPRSITDRLRALGVGRDAITELFVYLRPEVAAKCEQVDQVSQLLDIYDPAILVIDSVGEAMAMHKLKQNDDDAVVDWFNFMPREWAKRTCVVLIDHVPKSNDAPTLHAIGSQRKKAALDGAMYRVDQVKPLGIGLTGRLALTTAKDRQGTHPLGRKALELEFASSAEGTSVEVVAIMPEERDEEGNVKRPTVLMGRVSELLEGNPGLSATQIETTVSGKASGIRKALGVLVTEGYIDAEALPGRGRGFRYRSLRPFRSDEIELTAARPDVHRPPVPLSSPEKGTGFDHPENRSSSPRPPSVLNEGRGTMNDGSNGQFQELPRPLHGDEVRQAAQAAPAAPTITTIDPF